MLDEKTSWSPCGRRNEVVRGLRRLLVTSRTSSWVVPPPKVVFYKDAPECLRSERLYCSSARARGTGAGRRRNVQLRFAPGVLFTRATSCRSSCAYRLFQAAVYPGAFLRFYGSRGTRIECRGMSAGAALQLALGRGGGCEVGEDGPAAFRGLGNKA